MLIIKAESVFKGKKSNNTNIYCPSQQGPRHFTERWLL